MRTLWPNLAGDDGLETVLEVPIPDEMFAASSNSGKSWRAIRTWLKSPRPSLDYERRAVEIQFLLGVIGAPLLPLPLSCSHSLYDRNIKAHPIEKSMASYIVQQYVAASGGEHALNSIESMCAVGKVKMAAADLSSDIRKIKSMKKGAGELGGFVLWQKSPALWSLELMLSGFKISAGCDGNVAWRQTPWQHSRASRGPPRPLRRSLQGLDPRGTADLFSNSICTGEKTINGDDCFVLKLEAESSTLMARSSSNAEINRHTIWGYFSQKTGLLVQLEDSQSLRIKSAGKEIQWETKTESLIQDYRAIGGVNIAHGGRTTVSLSRFGGDDAESCSRSRMEEIWSIEEIDFNVKGLSTECFLPPAELRIEWGDDCDEDRFRCKVLDKYSRSCASRSGKKKVVAIDEQNDDHDHHL
ncbi:uncharacterized protein LOC131019981 [Salvia miltiorrhiza]|uniref:uncharacterized protein LOC131019981 n=1 Tax=Salvia miltiorrhiza TaxID=226208 RepID=UPI0025AC3B67|nr:uncharacterized protein LOC131019981 [Salvia miltiorrhiza]